MTAKPELRISQYLVEESIRKAQRSISFAGRNIMKFAKGMLPVVYISTPLMGASSPASIAGTVVQFNAETLSGNVLMQLVSPGAPFVSYSYPIRRTIEQ